jgi:hypothetical protein
MHFIFRRVLACLLVYADQFLLVEGSSQDPGTGTMGQGGERQLIGATYPPACRAGLYFFIYNGYSLHEKARRQRAVVGPRAGLFDYLAILFIHLLPSPSSCPAIRSV